MKNRTGFTLIELLVVLAIVALLLSIVAPRYIQQTDRAQEAALKENLSTIRHSIDQYYADKGVYPSSLQVLVDQRYLRKLPTDSVTHRDDTWQFIYIDENDKKQLVDIKSGALGKAKDGTEYASW
ncbi:type II secretion system protein [Acinetobacter dispersus]|uniref:Type II secretion system protein G n=1 Tax=Acinetobacter dispersus TaxID=70348 RepID=N9MSX5_9GAMM|nr:prepilin-type N-terminal cleavage/methylation domain-containing protein [Acinetobacter dispersus]ENW93019.1 type II secretion system protein G [Acinetobacter dispersus]